MLKISVIAICLIVFASVGFTFVQNKETFGASENFGYCFTMNSDSDANLQSVVAARPCTPTGWWCQSNSECCSGFCTNNVYD